APPLRRPAAAGPGSVVHVTPPSVSTSAPSRASMPGKAPGVRMADGPVPPPREAGDTSDALVQAARAGDQAAFGRLVEMHQRPLTRLTHRLLGDRDEADGAAQDTFINAWKNIRTFRGERRLRTWATPTAVDP